MGCHLYIHFCTNGFMISVYWCTCSFLADSCKWSLTYIGQNVHEHWVKYLGCAILASAFQFMILVKKCFCTSGIMIFFMSTIFAASVQVASHLILVKMYMNCTAVCTKHSEYAVSCTYYLVHFIL